MAEPILDIPYIGSETTGDPFATVEIISGGSRKTLVAYVDTGCSAGLWILKKDTEGLELPNEISHVEPAYMATGEPVASRLYRVQIKVGKGTQEVSLCVVDPEEKIDQEDFPREGALIYAPLLGREFLDNYDSLFQGKKMHLKLLEPE